MALRQQRLQIAPSPFDLRPVRLQHPRRAPRLRFDRRVAGAFPVGLFIEQARARFVRHGGAVTSIFNTAILSRSPNVIAPKLRFFHSLSASEKPCQPANYGLAW